MSVPNRFAIATVILSIFVLGAGSAAAQTTAERPDLRTLRRDIRIFSGVMDTTMRDSFSQPFGLLEATKGAYLPGFGLVFSLEVNLVSLRTRWPFDPRPYSREELDQAFKLKQQRIGELEQRLPRLLADYGSNIQLPPADHVAVVVHFFNYPEEDREELPSGMVAQVSRQDLVEYKSGKVSYADLSKRVETLKF